MDSNRTCLHCGAKLEDNQEFCHQCGTKNEKQTFCMQCGSMLPSGNTFCANCGTPVSPAAPTHAAVPPAAMASAQNGSRFAPGPAVRGKRKVPVWVFIIIGLVVVAALAVGYFLFFNARLNSAKALYDDGQYSEAAEQIKGFVPIGNADLFREITFAGEVGANFEAYSTMKDAIKKASPGDASYKTVMGKAAAALLNGLKACSAHDKEANSDTTQDVLERFRSFYYSELARQFGLNQPDADKTIAENHAAFSPTDQAILDIVSSAGSEHSTGSSSGGAGSGIMGSGTTTPVSPPPSPSPASSAAPTPTPAAEPKNKQVVEVLVSGSNATVTLYGWKNGQWAKLFICGGFAGKNGLTSSKTEGDGKTPEGKYDLGFVFGLSEPGTGMPFKAVDSRTVWVDDVNSRYYNTWQESNAGYRDWNSAEDLYAQCSSKIYEAIVINFNGNGLGTGAQVVKGGGSAIYLDGRYSPRAGTTGDIDISNSDMQTLLGLLDYSSQPIIDIKSAAKGSAYGG